MRVKYFLILLLTVSIYDSVAQNSQVLYYMNLPQNHLLNPAMRSGNSVYIGLPGISGVNANINNDFFNFSDIFSLSQDGDSTISIFHPDYDISGFMKKIREINSLEAQTSAQLFNLGFNTGKDLYIFLDINERIDMDFRLPGEMLRLIFEGNEQFVGNRIDLSTLRTGINWYHEAGLGFSKNLTQRLRLGIKGKLLFGMANLSLDNKALNVTVNEDFTHIIDADLMANISAPVDFYVNEDNQIDSVKFDDSKYDSFSELADYFLDNSNMGAAVDIGLEYTLAERLRLSASLTDLGYIRWKRDITNLKAESQFKFSGDDFQDVYDGNMDAKEFVEELGDSLQKSFYMTDTDIPYRTNLPFGVSLGASYNLSQSFSLGVLSYTRFNGSQYKEALTFSANLNLGNTLSTTLAYTAANYRYDNIGFGMAFRLGIIQIYALADRIPLTWNRIINGDESIHVPEILNTIHARAGMNLVFGNKIKRKTDKPMILIQ